MSQLEVEETTRRVFGTDQSPHAGPPSQRLDNILRGQRHGSLDSRGVPCPYTLEEFRKVYPHRLDPSAKLTVEQEEELARRGAEELRQQSLAEARGTFACGAWGAEAEESASNEGGGEALADGEQATPVDGETTAEHGPTRAADGAPYLPPQTAADIPPRRDPWDTIIWGNEPSTPRRTVYGPALEPRQPTLVPGTIPGTNIPLSEIRDREFLALMLTTAAEEEEVEEVAAEPVPAPDEDPEEARARYMRTSGFRADDALWHQRLGHPSRATLENCIDAGVFAPGALLRPDGSEVSGATYPRNCTVCPEAALSHQPFPLLEPGTNRYPKLQKVYSDFLNVGHRGVEDELYTLTFSDFLRYVWVVNVESRDRAYEVFRLWLPHAERQSGKKLKIWQSDGAAEFKSNQMQTFLTQKGIEHHISLPYAHQHQGVAERTNRTLMTKVRALMKQSKLPPIYWTYAMHHAVRVHNLLSTTANTGNLSPHIKWTGTKGDTSMLRVWGCMVQYRPPTSTIGKFASRARWGIHLGISHEYKAWTVLDLLSQKTVHARDVIF
ncbi:unnamed protein product [Closterium sp. Yama58-4]|nr:unnamed protein product [Closterium sp. Yama58-4]